MEAFGPPSSKGGQMADTYKFYQEGAGIPYKGSDAPPFKRRLNVPDLIANKKLANTTDETTAVKLASTGFGAADKLELFQIPKGFIVYGVEYYVVTGEGATCTIDIGLNSATSTHGLSADDDLWEAAGSIETAGVLLGTGDADAGGTDNKIGELFITDGNICVLFNHATDTAVVDFWVRGAMVSAIS